MIIDLDEDVRAAPSGSYVPPAGGTQPYPQAPSADGTQPYPQVPPGGGSQPYPQVPTAGGTQPYPQVPPVGGNQPYPQAPPASGTQNDQMPQFPTIPDGTPSAYQPAGRLLESNIIIQPFFSKIKYPRSTYHFV